jgi:hypothetical protein
VDAYLEKRNSEFAAVDPVLLKNCAGPVAPRSVAATGEFSVTTPPKKANLGSLETVWKLITQRCGT